MPKGVKGFVKGIATNPNGRPPKERSLTNLMRQYLEEIPEGAEITRKKQFISKTFELASEGDATCMKLVWNYLDGMPKQSFELTGDLDKNPLVGKLDDYDKDSTNNTDDDSSDI